MTTPNRPAVLVVDDHADDERPRLQAWKESINVTLRHPSDVEENDLLGADLVVVDYQLDAWAERDSIGSVSLRPLDGLALSAVLRGHSNKRDGSPTAFMLRSAHLSELSGDNFPADSRLHVISWQNNLEWVQDKGASIEEQARQICSLGEAVNALPQKWPSDDAGATRQIIDEWFAIPDERWKPIAWQDIEDCHPPLHEISQRRHGLRFVRWFLHRILPYPCFLWTCGRLAARLRVTQESFSEAMTCGLADVFHHAKYNGQLRDFLGERWWRSGCESFLWDLTSGNSFDPEVTITTLNERCAGKLVRSPIAQPVLCVDEWFSLTNDVCNVENAVRVQPDDWPAYAEHAWVPLAEASANERLRAAVIANDRPRLINDGKSEGA